MNDQIKKIETKFSSDGMIFVIDGISEDTKDSKEEINKIECNSEKSFCSLLTSNVMNESNNISDLKIEIKTEEVEYTSYEKACANHATQLVEGKLSSSTRNDLMLMI